MTSRTRYLLAPALAASLTLGLVACGDDDDDAASTDTTAAPEESTTAPATDDTGTDDTTGSSMDDSEEPSGDLTLGQALPEELSLGYLGLTPADAEAKAEEDGVGITIINEGEAMGTTEVTAILNEAEVVMFASVANEDGTVEREGADKEVDLVYVGLTEEGATTAADNQGTEWRVVTIDGENQAVTMDFNPDRLNFDIVDSTVVAVTRG